MLKILNNMSDVCKGSHHSTIDYTETGCANILQKCFTSVIPYNMDCTKVAVNKGSQSKGYVLSGPLYEKQ
jgi:hypothetical protein